MKAISALLVSALLLTGCSQAIDYFYSKDNFTARSFDADLSDVDGKVRQLPLFKRASRSNV